MRTAPASAGGQATANKPYLTPAAQASEAEKKTLPQARRYTDHAAKEQRRPSLPPACEGRSYLRWRILARIRRFFWPSLRRPLPVFFTPIDVLPRKAGCHTRAADRVPL